MKRCIFCDILFMGIVCPNPECQLEEYGIGG